MKKIVIIGICGLGKTTIGKRLTKNLDYSLTDLNDLYSVPKRTLQQKAQFALLIESAKVIFV